MVTFLFWNLKGLSRQEIVARLVQEHQIDVLILAECQVADKDILRPLEKETKERFRKPWSESRKIQIFTRLKEHSLRAVFDDSLGRLTVRRLIVGSKDILLAAVHFPSKVNWSDHDQADEAQNLAREIRHFEEKYGHRRTLLVGDLNMNPFERGVISSHGLHAVMTREIAEKAERTVNGRGYPFFYNPMWGFFGDRTEGPPGSFYYNHSGSNAYFWNIFDQVLFRPELLPFFEGEVQLLDSEGNSSLLTRNGLPDKTVGSDHLPLLFRLNL